MSTDALFGMITLISNKSAAATHIIKHREKSGKNGGFYLRLTIRVSQQSYRSDNWGEDGFCGLQIFLKNKNSTKNPCVTVYINGKIRLCYAKRRVIDGNTSDDTKRTSIRRRRLQREHENFRLDIWRELYRRHAPYSSCCGRTALLRQSGIGDPRGGTSSMPQNGRRSHCRAAANLATGTSSALSNKLNRRGNHDNTWRSGAAAQHQCRNCPCRSRWPVDSANRDALHRDRQADAAALSQRRVLVIKGGRERIPDANR